MSAQTSNWFTVANVHEVPSPSLLVYPGRVEENVRRMIAIAGGVERLRPHMKTHKMAEMIRLQLKHGITKFKCATIAEAEMTAASGAADVLLAYQPVGPNVTRMVQLARQYPKARPWTPRESSLTRPRSSAPTPCSGTCAARTRSSCGRSPARCWAMRSAAP